MSHPPVQRNPQATAAPTPPLTFGKWLQERVTPPVIVAFFGGAATVIAAYFAATPHLDKTICSITIYSANNSTSMLEFSNRLLNANRTFSGNMKTLQATSNKNDTFNLTDVMRVVSPFEDLSLSFNIVDTVQVSNSLGIFMSDLNALYLTCPK